MKRNAVAWAALVISGAALVSSQALTRSLPAAPKVSTEGQKSARALSEAYVAVAEFVKPSVVQISVHGKTRIIEPGLRRRTPSPDEFREMDPKSMEEFFKKFFGPNSNFRVEPQQFGAVPGRGTGSGFVFDDRGHILTNNHVVDNASKITVTFHDGVEMPATVVGTDPQTDVAVIKVDSTQYPALPVGQSGKLKVGELVMAVGSPFGLSQSVSTGIISATDRNSVGINEFESFIQTDAAINPGNSGGPLVNMDGQVIGINSVIMNGGGRGNDGVGFAVPIDMASKVAENLIKNGKVQRSRVGIKLDTLTPALARQLRVDPKVKGVVVGEVWPGTPAEKAGLKPGDVITSFNGNPVLSLPNFRMAVATSSSGKEFGLNYIREGKEMSTTIVPAPYEKVSFGREEATETKESPKTVVNDFGLEVQELSSELAQQFKYGKDAKGLIVTDVKSDSPAEAAGLKDGDLIVKIVKDGKTQTLTSVKEFDAVAGKANEIALYVSSRGLPNRFVTLSKASKD